MDNTIHNITLTGHPEFLPDKLLMRYDVTNRGATDVYVVDGVPAVDQSSRKAFVDFNSVYLCWRPPATALLLRGITPLPANKTVVVRIIPVGTKLAPGQKVERTFEVQLPLREQSVYYSPLKPEEVEDTKVSKLLLVVQFMRSTVEGFNAEPAPYAPEFYIVRGKHTVGQVESLECQFNIQDVQLLKRTDAFTRR